ncbi:MAG: hypothetical protein ACE5I1_04745 [bacterium]
MTQTDLRSIVTAQSATAHEKFSELPVLSKIKLSWEMFRLQASLIFSQKLLWFILGIIVYMGLVYLENYNDDIVSRITQEQVITDVLAFPLVVLAVLLNMFLISGEKEKRTLEGMFTTAGSRYKVWLLRIVSLNVVFFLMALGLSALTFFTFTDMPIFGSTIHIFIPVFLLGNMTLYFSVKFRSALAAGMVAGLAIFFLIILNAGFEEEDMYRYMLFFNPYDLPRDIDPATWSTWTWQNKIAVSLVGCGFLFAALRGMDNREKLLR